ncbi:hypothetical protein C8R43DRAFT_911875 [Mycena crocata]|nr:hypothetical protein C8R43DRAFT_911875 [Mycena crocata]
MPPAIHSIPPPFHHSVVGELGSQDGREVSPPADATHPSAADILKTPTKKTLAVSAVTPQRSTSHDSEGAFLKIQDIRNAISVELEDAWVGEDTKTLPFQANLRKKIDDAYPDLERKAEEWLASYPGYDAKAERWTKIPKEPKYEKELYEPLAGLMRDIVTAFGNDSQAPGENQDGEHLKTRSVKVTWDKKLVHSFEDAQGEKTVLKSCPDICILGTGPSATPEAEIHPVPSYSQVATPVEIKLHETFGQLVKDQTAVYARECLITQQNRSLVYTPVMTKKTIRVLQFDRSGVEYSEPINYHDDPIFFIKLVVLFSSLHEDLLGYDTSIYWRDGKRWLTMIPTEVREDGGSTPEWKSDHAALTFEILNKDGESGKDSGPLFARRTIRSRGTICWRVKDDQGREFLIKDYWGAAGRTAESVFLKIVAGVPGVGQMHAFTDARKSTYGQRGFKAKPNLRSTTGALVPNRFLMRLALRMYMPTLNTASSAVQLLRAVQDIVRGHRDALLSKGILHRDISFHNLLLSSVDDEYGVLIDFDMAKKMEDIISSHTEGDSRTGTRAYQSIKVLLQSERLGHHDHMDDLESIYYVLFYVCYGHDSKGNLHPTFPSPISLWHNPLLSPDNLAQTKRSFLQNPIAIPLTRFGSVETPVLQRAMNQLRKFFGNRLDEIGEASAVDSDSQFPAYSSETALDDYSKFLALISGTIDQLEKLPVIPTPALPPPSPKRPRDPFEDDDNGPPTPPLKYHLRSANADKSQTAVAKKAKGDDDEESSDEHEDVDRDEYVPGRKPRPRTSKRGGGGR